MTSIRTPRTDKPDSRTRRPAAQVAVEWRDPDRTLVDYVAAIWSRKVWIAIAAGIGTAAATLYALTRPNVYASHASLLVTGNRGGSSAAEVALNIVRMGNIGPSQVLTALEVVNSTEVSGRVVDSVGADEITKPYQPERAGEEERRKMGLVDQLTDWMHRLQASWFQRAATPSSMQADAAADQFRRSFAAWADERASLIKLTYRAGSRIQAQRILEEVVQVAIDRYREVTAPPESRQWVLQRLESAEKEYNDARSVYDQFIGTYGRVNFKEEITASERVKSTTEGLLDSTTRLRAINQDNLASYHAQKKDMKELRERKRRVTENLSGVRVELLKERIQIENLKIKSEASNQTENLTYKSYVAQLENIDRRLAELDEPREVTVVDDNPDYVLLENRIRDATMRQYELDHEIPRLEAELKQQAGDLKTLYTLQNDAEQIVEDLTRTKAEFERLRSAKDQYEFTAQLDALGLTSLQPVDSPNIPLQKEGPQRGRIILAGFAAGLLLSLTAIMLMVRMSRNILRTSEASVCLGRGDVVGLPWLESGNVRRFRLARKRGWD